MTLVARRRRIDLAETFTRKLGVLVVMVAIAACSGGNPSASGTQLASKPSSPVATDPAAAHQRAAAVLGAWAKAVATAGAPRVVPVGDLTGQIGDWEPAVGDNNKRALMAGLVFTDTPLPEVAPPDGVVTWQDGTTTKVRLLSAQDALVAIGSTTSASCLDCAPLTVTEPRLTSGPIETTRGPATAPIWEFSVQGSAVKATRVGLANPIVISPGEADPQLGLAVSAARTTVGGRDLTVAFIGAPDPGDRPCGEDYTAEAVESKLAVVVIVTRHPHPVAAFGGACAAVGARRTATATLGAALHNRAVLDLLSGTPVTVVVAP